MDQHESDFEALKRLLAVVESLPRKWWGPREYGDWNLARGSLERLRDRSDPEKEQLT